MGCRNACICGGRCSESCYEAERYCGEAEDIYDELYGKSKEEEEYYKAKEIIKDLSKSLFLAKGIVRDLIDDTVDFKESKERAIYCYEREKFDIYKQAEQFLRESE